MTWDKRNGDTRAAVRFRGKRHDEFIRNLINERLADSQVPGLRFVDMSTEFDGVEKSTCTDLIHAEQHANVLLAESIFRILREIVAADTG